MGTESCSRKDVHVNCCSGHNAASIILAGLHVTNGSNTHALRPCWRLQCHTFGLCLQESGCSGVSDCVQLKNSPADTQSIVIQRAANNIESTNRDILYLDTLLLRQSEDNLMTWQHVGNLYSHISAVCDIANESTLLASQSKQAGTLSHNWDKAYLGIDVSTAAIFALQQCSTW